jgi:hypothetical protein
VRCSKRHFNCVSVVENFPMMSAREVPWRCIPELCVPELSVPGKIWWCVPGIMRP